MVKIRAVLFDYGGTLDSDGGHWLDRFQALYRQAGLAIEGEKIKEAFYKADGLLPTYPGIRELSLQELIDLHVELQFQFFGVDDRKSKRSIAIHFASESAQTLKRNVKILARLKEKFKLGLISNFYGNVEIICREFDLAPLLDLILDSSVVGVSKPDPKIFKIALERLALPPEEAVYVGDSFERDMVAAKGVGLYTIWLTGPDERVCPDEKMVDRKIKTLLELPRVLETL
ncbi:MAG: HAD family hydrolase [Candidatus Tectomicrobia bacterium]|nr:HAD family hydrolase [Candidatus Tectomicrobia bacterium]